jgi:AraC family transcriptional regulator
MLPVLGPDRYLGERRDRLSVAGLTLTEYVYPAPTVLPLHTHVAPYFCLVLSGGFEERMGRTVTEARAGALLYHPPGETHEDVIRSPGTLLFNIALGDHWAERLGEIGARGRPRPGHQSPAATRVARRTARELSARDAVSRLAIEGLVLTLLAEASASPSPIRGGRWMPVALDFIRAHFRDPFDHRALARVSGVHATHLARAFRAQMGCTVTAYVHGLRIAWARTRIARDDTPLADLALEAGFADQAHFSRVFRRATGSTPSEYRRRARGHRSSTGSR